MIPLLLAILFTQSAHAFDESINHAPPFQVFQRDPAITALLPSKGNGLCWPSSLAHRILYLKNFRRPPLPKLSVPLVAPGKKEISIPETVKQMADLCNTDNASGTRQSDKVPCIVRYFKNNGMTASAFIIGPASRGLPASDGSHNQLRQVEIEDFRKYIKMDYGIILHVGWLKFNPGKKAWIESGSHSLNVYGFDYDQSWKNNQIVLKVANPLINYSARGDGKYYDSVTVTPIEQTDVSYPPMRGLKLTGPGFNTKNVFPVIDDLFVFSP